MNILRPTLACIAVLAAAPAAADGGKTRLSGYAENPVSLSTPASGTFRAKIRSSDQTIEYQLSYAGVESGATAAHIHFGKPWQVGAVAAFLCANGQSKPPGVPDCPANGGTVTGVITPAEVVGPAAQGIAPGEFAELVEAIREGVAYVNVHSATYPGGEIRGQLRDWD